jgi:membrane-bound metal-dependent hydrolase YbcI (DUF457 family)
MLGRNHLLLAASCGFLIGSTTHRGYVAVGCAVVTATAGVIPDIDEPESSISRLGGLLTRLASVIIAKVAGGHRALTHSLAFIAAGVIASLFLLSSSTVLRALLVVCSAVCLTMALRSVFHVRRDRFVPAIVGIGVGLVLPPSPVDLLGLPIGLAVHVFSDALTGSGVPLLWPIQKRFGANVLGRVGSRKETVLTFGVVALTCLVGFLLSGKGALLWLT